MLAAKEVSIERVSLVPVAPGGAAGTPGHATLDRRPQQDRIVVEAPLGVTARGQRVLTLMRTPGHDLELIAGLLHAEALPPAVATAVVRPAGSAVPGSDDLVEVDLDPALFAPRALASVAACGVCGRQTIADLERVARAVTGDFTVAAAVLSGLPATLRRVQEVFDETGGLHAAALATAAGELRVVREDVGRHNAVDKVVGWALAAGAAAVPASQHVLLVSGRLGYEIVQKAVRFGCPVVAAVSAPSSLAVELAERFGVALCGFVRGDHFNIYSHAWRIT
jgi:FdhD protein